MNKHMPDVSNTISRESNTNVQKCILNKASSTNVQCVHPTPLKCTLDGLFATITDSSKHSQSHTNVQKCTLDGCINHQHNEQIVKRERQLAMLKRQTQIDSISLASATEQNAVLVKLLANKNILIEQLSNALSEMEYIPCSPCGESQGNEEDASTLTKATDLLFEEIEHLKRVIFELRIENEKLKEHELR